MDDPWANAWGESSKSVLPEPSPNWSAPSVSALHGDHEDDLSNPAWPKESSTHWAADDVADSSIWGTETASSSSASAWNPEPSTFDKISLGGESYPDLAKASLHAKTTSKDFTAEHDRPATASPSSPVDDESEPETSAQPLDYRTLTPPSLVPPPITIPPLEDPDGFGSFATASTEDAPGWTPSKPSFQIASADAAAWGGGWEEPSSASAKSEQEDSEDEEDEWEAARRQKEMQDKHVPPELLASILGKMDALSDVLWPNKEPTADELDKARHIDFESLGLQSAAQKLIPVDLVLPMNGPFTKTFTSKQLSESLKLTRHSFIAKSSPMAMYMVSKGSTSWEASIKARAATAPEDVAPAGWKIVEQAPVDSSADDGKKKAGGFFSFFGRKATTASVDSIKRPGSPGSISGISSIKPGASPRPSVDSSRSSVAPSNPVTGPGTPSVLVPEANSTVILISESESMSATSPLAETSAEIMLSEATPPSAVSRFLGRFSGKNRRSASRDSLALSMDDIEFLSDVPTTSPSNDVSSGSDLDALSLMLKAPPPPLTTTLPAPLPPPPKPAQLPRIAPPPVPTLSPPPAAPPLKPVTLLAPTPAPPPSMTINDNFEDFWEATAAKTPPKVEPSPSRPSSDPFSFFDAPPTNPPLPRNPTPSMTPEPAPLNTRMANDDDDDWASFDVPAPQPTKPIAPIARPPVTKQSPPPPPAQAKRSFVPIMNSSRSSTPVNANSTSPFSFPPPPTFTQPRLAMNGPSAGAGHTPVIAPLAPPPSASRPPIPLANFGSSIPNNLSSSVSAPVFNQVEEDDDFTDFLSSPPAGPSQTQPTSFVEFDTPAPVRVEQALASTHASPAVKANNNYDNFGFLDPAPSPSIQKQTLTSSSSSPATGRKLSLPGINSTGKPSLPSMKTSSGHVRKVSREADHARTQSLLDSAAARGRWLAPPSPIPEALSPPPDSGSLGGFSPPKASGFDGTSTMQTQQAHAVASIASRSKGNGAMLQPPPAWSFPAPPSMNGSSFLPKNAIKASATPPPQALPSAFLQPAAPLSKGFSLTPSPTPSQRSTTSGGLSAQDLSFFEGL